MKRKLTILTCFIALCSFAFGQNHWTPNTTSQNGLTMTVVATVSIDGTEQTSSDLEVGVFDGEIVRGSARLEWYDILNRSIVRLNIYGDAGDNMTLKLYDHNTETELDYISNNIITFVENGSLGKPSAPYQINFNSPVVNVAKIGDVEYTTLEAAFNAAETGDEVVVLNDIILPATSENGAFEIAETVGNVTLNLNGFDITSSERIGYTGRTNYAFDNYANLTIKGEGTITARGIQNYGTLTIEGNDVTIISNDEIGDGACIWGYQGSATIIKGGTFRGLAKGAGAINTEGSLEITGGTFSAEGKQDEGYHVYTIICQGAYTENTISDAAVSGGKHGVIAVTKGAKLNIDNVTATRAGVHGQSGHVLYVADNGKLTINGGTFVNEDASAGSSVINTDANSNTDVTGGTFTNQGTANVISGAGTTTLTGGTYSSDVNIFCAEGYAALPSLQNTFVVGETPTATVNNLGMTTVAAGDYMVYGGGTNTEDMPLSFVMQFLADQNAQDMETSPFAEWYGDFVITFTGIENGSFTADECYLAGHYGSFGWVKVPVDGMTIEDGVRYPVMLAVGLGQKYEYICSSVEDFKCALYLTPEILAANPNIQVNLELAIVDNSQGEDAAASALVNNTNVYEVVDYVYDADDFMVDVARIGDNDYPTLAEAVEAAEDNQTITLLRDAEGAGVVIDKDVTIDFAGFAYTLNEGEVISIQEGGVATFVNDANITEGVELFGGQLYTTNGKLTIVAKKNVVASSSWSTLSAPTQERKAVFNTEAEKHDFYQYVESAKNEWEYIGDEVSDNSYTMQAGRGYLYATNAEVSFTGTLNHETVTYPLSYTATQNLAGFHLIGNPFTHNISFAHLEGKIASGYYVVGENKFIAVEPTTSTEVIAPFQAVLVQATEKDDYFSINKEAVRATREVSNGVIEIVASNGSYSDVAYVSFNEGYGLEKMAHNNANVPMVYLPVGDKNYAIAKYNQDVNEIPVSFVAQTMGEYTIGVKSHDCAFESMYLTDRMTGERVNLLLEDYTFIATSNDNADRFMLTFATTGVEETKEESYIFINNDNMIINNVAGNAIVRIVDMMGRVVAAYNVNESASISTSSLNSGVYVIQMSDDNGVKVQKVVIE